MPPSPCLLLLQVVAVLLNGSDTVTVEQLEELLQAGGLRVKEEGRYTVALSLVEAETVRRIIHLNQGKQVYGGLDSGSSGEGGDSGGSGDGEGEGGDDINL